MLADDAALEDVVFRQGLLDALPKEERFAVAASLPPFLAVKLRAQFGEDAERASALLGIALTTRDRDKGDQALPMAGFPHPALDSYLAKIVQAGP